MSIANKLTVGLVSIALIATSVAVSPAASAQQTSVDQLQAQVNALLAQLASLQGANAPAAVPATTQAVAHSGNAACPYTWTRNLSIGSSGDDVRQLQMFLNGYPQTRVAASGVGSPGNETTYYGPATARAVSAFQEMHAAQILTPLGLSKGTGGFYTSTRKVANDMCKAAPVATPQPVPQQYAPVPERPAPVASPRVSVTGSGLAVTAGNQPADAFAQKGALRIPYTVVVLTAGNRDVQVGGVRVRVDGLVDADNFSGVALTDENGLLYGSTKRFNSRDEATVGGSFALRANSSHTFVVVANITNEDDDFNGSGLGSISVVDVVTDSEVQGAFPITGASHAFTDAVDLPSVRVDVSDGDNTVELNEDTELAVVDVELKDADQRDEARLRSLTLKNEGSASREELGDLSVLVDGDPVRATIMEYRDEYTLTFPGSGLLVEDGENVEIILVGNTNIGTGETVQFYLEDTDDVYAVGTRFGYGLPVVLKDDSGESTSEIVISAGEVRRGSRVRDFDDTVEAGRDVILAAKTFEFEGEDVEFEGLTFRLRAGEFEWASSSDNDWETSDVDELTIDNLELWVDDLRVSYASDLVEFSEPSSSSAFEDYGSNRGTLETEVEFADNFIVDVREQRDVRFEIRGDLESDWAHEVFDGIRLRFDLVSVDTAEGVSSEEDYAAGGEAFDVDSSSNAIAFEDVSISGNEVDIAFSGRNVDETEYVAGHEDIVFGTLEIDARESSGDVELDEFYVTIMAGGSGASGDVNDIERCELHDDRGSSVATARDPSASGSDDNHDVLRFRFDSNTVVSADSREDFDVVCDIDDDADTGDEYIAGWRHADDRNRVEYSVGRDNYEKDLGSSEVSDTITVKGAGTLTIAVDRPDGLHDAVDAFVISSSGFDGQAVTEIELEADGEDIRVTDIYLRGIKLGGVSGTPSAAEMREVISALTLHDFTGDIADDGDLTASYEIPTSESGLNSPETLSNGVIRFADVGSSSDAVVRDGGDKTFEIHFDYAGLSRTRGVAGSWLTADEIVVTYEGETSDEHGLARKSFGNNKFVKGLAHSSVPTVTTRNVSSSSAGSGEQKLYDFTVDVNDEGEIYLAHVTFDVDLPADTKLTDIRITEGGDTVATASDYSTTGAGTLKLIFTETERIRDGRTFLLYANILDAGGDAATGWEDDATVVVELKSDGAPADTVVGQEYTSVGGVGFAWSPNTLEKDGTTTSNADWFGGYGIYDTDDTYSVSLEH